MHMPARTDFFSLAIVFLVALLASCASSIHDGTGLSSEVTAESFTQSRDLKGIVLLAVNWGRRWNCGGFENAELRSLSFDRLPVRQLADGKAADLTLEGPARLMALPAFINYALLVDPGEYASSEFNIKVARSVSDVRYWVAKRSELLKDGRPQGGSFTVAPGETVYIGNFFLDCYQRPSLCATTPKEPATFSRILPSSSRSIRFSIPVRWPIGCLRPARLVTPMS